MFDIEKTRHLAELSRIEFSEEELLAMTDDMTDIIALMDKVKEFDPQSGTYTLTAAKYADLRADAPEKSLDTDKVLSGAERVKYNSFVVPKVV